MDNNNRLTTMTVKGKVIAVYVDSKGRFYCNTSHDHKNEQAPFLGDGDPDVLEAKTLDDLKKKAEKQLGARKISIEVWKYIEDRYTQKSVKKFMHGICTGRHSANRNLLVRWDGRSHSEQESSWGDPPVIFSEKEQARYLELQDQAQAIETELNELKSKGKERLKAALTKAIGSEG